MTTSIKSSIRLSTGFTLIEAMVALVIVSLALIAMSTKMSMAINIAGKTERSTYARWVAMNAIAELRVKPGLPKEGTSDGDEVLAGLDWRWDMDISNTPVDGLKRVDVDVALATRPDKIIYSMSAFVGTNHGNVQARPWEGIPGGSSGQPGNPNNPVAPPQVPGTNPPGGNPRPRPPTIPREPIG